MWAASLKIKLFINLSTFRQTQYIIRRIEENKIKSYYDFILYFYSITVTPDFTSQFYRQSLRKTNELGSYTITIYTQYTVIIEKNMKNSFFSSLGPLNICLHPHKTVELNYDQSLFFSCKEYYNFNAFFAILMGLSDVAVSRLSTTWDKLPSKSRKQFTEYETLIDPSRNHRAYRITVGKLPSPMIPFMPLLIKGRINSSI